MDYLHCHLSRCLRTIVLHHLLDCFLGICLLQCHQPIRQYRESFVLHRREVRFLSTAPELTVVVAILDPVVVIRTQRFMPEVLSDHSAPTESALFGAVIQAAADVRLPSRQLTLLPEGEGTELVSVGLGIRSIRYRLIQKVVRYRIAESPVVRRDFQFVSPDSQRVMELSLCVFEQFRVEIAPEELYHLPLVIKIGW